MHLRQAVTLANRDAENHVELGLCFFKQNQYAEAIREYREAVRLEETNINAQQGLALSLMAIEHFDEAERHLRPLVRPKAHSRVDSREVCVIHQTLAELFTCLGDKRGDEIYYEEAAIEVDKAISGASDNRKAELYFKRGIINCYRKQYEIAEKDFARCVNEGDTQWYWSAKRNLERLQTSLLKRRSKTLEKLGIVAASLAILQLVGIWILYMIGSSNGKEYISTKTFAILAPLFFAFTLISLLLPQLSKLKVAGLEAEIEKISPEPLVGPKGLRLETSGTLVPSSSLTRELGEERERGAERRQ